MQLNVIELTDDLTHLGLEGKLDISGVHMIDTRFHAQTAGRKRNTIIDLSGVDFISSLGIGLLVGCASSLKSAGARMILLKPNEMIADVLARTSVEKFIPIVSTMDEAEAVLNGQGG